MKRRNPRGLRPEEQELWEKVRSNTVPLHPTSRRAVLKAAIETPKPEIKHRDIPSFRLGEMSTSTAIGHDIVPNISDRLASAPLRMDRKKHTQMKRGKISPDARIDLHGMTLAQAHPALIRFIVDAHSSGRRLVLVITGKGKPGDDGGPFSPRRGVLKQQVPHWLQSGPLRPLVLQVTEAHLKHGGSGAYYVFLSRNK